MKLRRLLFVASGRLSVVSLPSCLLLALSPANAAIYRWDPGMTPLSPSGGNGTWDGATDSWSDWAIDVIWPNGTSDHAVFGGSVGSVTLGLPVSANRLIFNTTGYTLSGTDPITLSGSNPQIYAGPGIVATISPPLDGAANLIKSGAGTISLTSALHTYTSVGGTPATLVNGGILSVDTAGVLPTINLSLSNGEFAMTGTAAGPRSQTVGALTPNAGRDAITLTADAAQPITFTAASLATRGVGSSILVRGTGLGTVAPGTAGAANVIFTAAPTAVPNVLTMANNPFAATGTGTLGSTQAAVLRGFTVSTSPTGTGSSFATYDPTNGVRALSASEKLTVADGAAYTAASAGDNIVIDLTGPVTITGKQTNTLEVANTSGSQQTLTNSGNLLLPANGLLFTGNSETTLSGGTLAFNNGSGANSDVIIHSSNTSPVTFSTAFSASGANLRSFTFGGTGDFIITSPNVPSSSNGGNYFNGPGNVELRSTEWGPSSAGTVINGGTVKLGVGFKLRTSVTRAVFVANGATFDINNIVLDSTPTSGVDSIQNVNLQGGTVTNTGATVTNLAISQNNNSGDFAGTVTGNINLVMNRQGDTTTNGRSQKFTNALSYVGSTSITSASTTSTAAPGTPANPTAFMIIGFGGSLPSSTDLTLGGKITVNGTIYGLESNGTTANGMLTLGETAGAVNQTVASLATGITPGPLTAVRGGAATNSTLTVNGSADTTFAGILGGPGANDKRLSLVRGGTGHLTLSGVNNYVGDTTLSASTSKLTLSSTGALSFVIGANGENNKITGIAQTTGALNLNGTLNFDLTAADATGGNSWQIVDSALLPTTSFTGLTVAGFTNASGVWTMSGGVGFNWVFRESTGALTYEASTGGSYATWAAANGIPGEPASGDFDHDGLTNLVEYALGKDPTKSSTPAGSVSVAGGFITVSFPKGADAVANGDVTWTIQESDDLGITDAWSAVTPTVNDGTTISYTRSSSQPTVFLRLMVVK
jgi:fibronectin-binding autotransporter adhesin